MKYLSIIFVILLLTNCALNNRWHCEGSNYVSIELPRNCSWNSKSEEYDLWDFHERERCYRDEIKKDEEYFAEYGKEREIELTVIDLFENRPECKNYLDADKKLYWKDFKKLFNGKNSYDIFNNTNFILRFIIC